MQKKIVVEYIAPLVAMGFLALGTAQSAESEIAVAMANPPRHAVTPPQKPQPSSAAEADGVVSGAAVNVRSGPGTAFGVVATLKQGDEVKIEATQSGWLTIAWPEAAPLWISKEGTQLKDHEATLRVAGSLRGAASPRAETVSKLDAGTKLSVLEERNGWLRVKAPASVRVYISAKFVTTGAEAKKVAASAAPAAPAAKVEAEKVGVAAASVAKPAPAKASAPKDVVKPNVAPAAVAPKPEIHEAARVFAPASNPIPIEEPAKSAESKSAPPPPAAPIAKREQGTVDDPKSSKPMPVTLSTRAQLVPAPTSSAPAVRPAAKPAARVPKVEGPEILIAEPPKQSVYLPAPGPAGDFAEGPTLMPTSPPEISSAPASAPESKPAPAPAPIVTRAVPPPAAAPAPVATTVTAAAAIHSGSGALHLNDRSFAAVVDNKGLAIVDFNATWCGPCRRMGPVVESFANDVRGEAAIAKLDVDESPVTASRYDVHSIPCLIIFKDGQEVERHYGVHEPDDMREWLRKHK